MTSARYFVVLVLVVSLPPALIFWLLIRSPWEASE